MNERIKELAVEADFMLCEDGHFYSEGQSDKITDKLSKFAELIVQECLTKCDEVQTMYGQFTFTAKKCKESIQQHFGVD